MTPEEPLLDLDDIQGNIFPGFNKDHQTFKFLVIADVAKARQAVASLLGFISTSTSVRQFGLLRASIKAQNGGAASGLSAIWMNLAFGYSGIVKLADEATAKQIGGGDEVLKSAFEVGLAARSPLLGDPSDPATDGHPSTWSIGKPGSAPIDVVITIAGDQRDDVDAFSKELDVRLAQFATAQGQLALQPVIADLQGDTLGGDLNGHEHFGFKDGISQPAIRGRRKSAPDTFVTERILDPNSSLAGAYARPGQVLLWPGQILLGQLRQNGSSPQPLPPQQLPADWIRNGSFMVLRLLEQDVPGFWNTMSSYALNVLGRNDDKALDWIGARIVGRWRSGAPITRSPNMDDPSFIDDNRIVNDFGFRNAGIKPSLIKGQPPLPDLPLSISDPNGDICPFAGHIRKVNPRDDAVELGAPGEVLARLLVRRGVPYGPAYPDPRHAQPDGNRRGLVFVSYQASIERQFEFLMQNWVQGNDSPRSGGGRDAVLGSHGAAAAGLGPTSIRITGQDGAQHDLPQLTNFITPRGGGYFFAPSLSGLATLVGMK
jgi:Dyp-type peroxidase family